MYGKESWGRYPSVEQKISLLTAPCKALPATKSSLLAYGQGRSYGDSCLNAGGLVLGTRNLDHFIKFDQQTGLLEVEAGVCLQDVIAVCLPRGWFLPVSPGTQYVSVGGAIANDVHGKNHHCAGTFGCFLKSFELLRSDGEILRCSPDSNAELFSATIGGLGLTGLILKAEFQLKRAANAYIDQECIRFESLGEFFEISRASDKDFEYTVAWLDCVSSGATFGRGHFMRGNHNTGSAGNLPQKRKKLPLSVPIDFPEWALNRYSVKLFNTAYYHRQLQKVKIGPVHYEPFFYPLDAVGNWNRIYGKRGLVQFQCVIPPEHSVQGMSKILNTIVDSGQASFLAVLKEFGAVKSPALLSFPRPGSTLCLDFPFRGERTLKLMRSLEELVNEYRGALYPAKDALMAPESFKQYFPAWNELSRLKDPAFSSSFWRRVTGEG